MSSPFVYELVELANGSHTLRSVAEGETFHPVVGPIAEAEALYVSQLKIPERVAGQGGPFVIWDIGLGAAANVLTLLRHTSAIPGERIVISFDHTLQALRFALEHREVLGYFKGFESAVQSILDQGKATFEHERQQVTWQFIKGDFPSCVRDANSSSWPKPHAILFDAYSPAKNPEMWTQPLFTQIFRLLDAGRPCALPTYSRSTLLRVSLLLAGFFVGAGGATGEKEETTIAANTLELLDRPLGQDWLARARRSTSAEPLWEPIYRQEPLRATTWERLQLHPQFAFAR